MCLTCQDVLCVSADHLLLLVGAVPGHLPPHLSVHHGGHRQDNQVSECGILCLVRRKQKVEFWIFALLSIVAEVTSTLSDRANKTVLCVNTRGHANVITTSPHRFDWALDKYFVIRQENSVVFVCHIQIEVEESFLFIWF